MNLLKQRRSNHAGGADMALEVWLGLVSSGRCFSIGDNLQEWNRFASFFLLPVCTSKIESDTLRMTRNGPLLISPVLLLFSRLPILTHCSFKVYELA